MWGSEIFSALKLLASPSLTDAGRRHVTSRSETKDLLLTAGQAAEADVAPKACGWCSVAQQDVAQRRNAQSAGNPKVLQWAASKPARDLPCRDTFSLLYWIVTCSPLWEETPSPSFQAVHYHYTNIPEKRVQNICYQYLCL